MIKKDLKRLKEIKEKLWSVIACGVGGAGYSGGVNKFSHWV